MRFLLAAVVVLVGVGQVEGAVVETKLTASDAAAGDFFGSSVAISGNTAIVGASGSDDGGSSSGSAYLFNVTTGEEYAVKLTTAVEEDAFGYPVAISGTTAIVGARNDNDGGYRSGSAYLFDADPLSGTFGDQLFKLTADDPAAEDKFGSSVAISGNTAIVGAYGNDDGGNSSGSAYMFDTDPLSGTFGDQLFKLTADDAAVADHFGHSVAISGNMAIVGAYYDDDDGQYSGSAYLFDVTTGSQLGKLTADDAAAMDFFGNSVAISGTTAIVGAYRDGDAGDRSGSAYLFDADPLSGTFGDQLFKLTANDAAAEDYFGNSVAISGNTAIVGAWWDDDGGDRSGSAYLFDVTTGSQLGKLTADDAAATDFFGHSVAIGGNTAIVGAYNHDNDPGQDSGSAYLYKPVTAPIPEPATILIWSLLGIIGITCYWKRRSR